jgi:hypothetical protein
VRLLATLRTIYLGEIILKKYQGEIGPLYIRDENSNRKELGLYVLPWIGNPSTTNCIIRVLRFRKEILIFLRKEHIYN